MKIDDDNVWEVVRVDNEDEHALKTWKGMMVKHDK